MSLKADLLSGIAKATKDWKKEKRKADKEDRISRSQHRNFYRVRSVSLREIAFSIIESAYNEASTNGKYYANARQIMYKARPMILNRYDKTLSDNFDVYFTQTLLKDYLEAYEPFWKIVWDARGHFAEPHTGERIGLGGIEVEDYIKGWHNNITKFRPSVNRDIKTAGPANRYTNVLFIEKEGFTEILQDAGFQERYDMALMSTKGVPVKAACDLLYRMKKSFSDIKIFVLHDFDLAGFKIRRTLQNGVRLSIGTDVIDIGFRIQDIEGIESESVEYKQTANPSHYLRQCGATPDEINFLVSAGRSYYSGYAGRRVELNAMSSEQLIKWLDMKLKQHGATKYIPEADAIKKAYNRARYLIEIDKRIDEIRIDQDNKETPPDLIKKIEAKLIEDPLLSWDKALWNIIQNEDTNDND